MNKITTIAALALSGALMSSQSTLYKQVYMSYQNIESITQKAIKDAVAVTPGLEFAIEEISQIPE